MGVKTFKFFGCCLMTAIFTIAGIAGITEADAGDLNIVTVDTNEIVSQHPALVEAQQTLQGEAQKMQQEIEGKGQEQQQVAQQQLQERSQELQLEAVEKAKKDIREIAAEKGYEYVMDTNALLVGGEDVTEEVLAEMEKQEDKD
ncbi:MAG: OmpH family outer membrane protein [Desulfosudaceae bacterium]